MLGDRRYGTGDKLPEKARRIGRQMLHASSIAVIDANGKKEIRATAPLPSDFRKALRAFGLT